jgi:hypothetical protein
MQHEGRRKEVKKNTSNPDAQAGTDDLTEPWPHFPSFKQEVVHIRNADQTGR